MLKTGIDLYTLKKSPSLGKINKLHLPSIILSLFTWNLQKGMVLQYWCWLLKKHYNPAAVCFQT